MIFKNSTSGVIIDNLIITIQNNRDYLSEIDGKIGDGDHGINMNKGFTMCREKLAGKTYSFSEGLKVLSETLMDDIGGSMGPLYGVFFEEISLSINKENISAEIFAEVLNNSIKAIKDIGNAKPGDKTLLDTLVPAYEAFENAHIKGNNFYDSLNEMKDAATKLDFEFVTGTTMGFDFMGWMTPEYRKFLER